MSDLQTENLDTDAKEWKVDPTLPKNEENIATRKNALTKATDNLTPMSRSPLAVALAIVLVTTFLLAIAIVDERFLSSRDFEVLPSAQQLTATDLYNDWAVSETRRVFEWHARSTRILFWVSMLMTVAGVVFAYWQFVDANVAEKVAESSDLEMKSKFISLAFKARSIAALTLFMSFAYLLAYLLIVYEVRPVSSVDSLDGAVQLTSEEAPAGLGAHEETNVIDVHPSEPKHEKP